MDYAFAIVVMHVLGCDHGQALGDFHPKLLGASVVVQVGFHFPKHQLARVQFRAVLGEVQDIDTGVVQNGEQSGCDVGGSVTWMR